MSGMLSFTSRLMASRLLPVLRSGRVSIVRSAVQPVRSLAWTPRLASSSQSAEHSPGAGVPDLANPTHFQKKTLVWAKMYPSFDEVPDRVTGIELKRARNWFRVRVLIILIAFNAVGAYYMILAGRESVREGDSLSHSGMDWVKEQQEIGHHKHEEEAKKKH